MASEKSGAGTDDLYEPNLWYFSQLEFLIEFEIPKEGISTISSDEENVSETPVKSTKRRKYSGNLDRNELLRKATMHMDNLGHKKERDEADIYGDAWAQSYRKLSAKQKIFAKKACDEIVILGLLEQLTINAVRNEASEITSSMSYRSSSCSSLPHIISVQDVSNGQLTPVYMNNTPTPQVYHEEGLASIGSQHSSFTELLQDTSFS